jgi:hypothetical protein
MVCPVLHDRQFGGQIPGRIFRTMNEDMGKSTTTTTKKTTGKRVDKPAAINNGSSPEAPVAALGETPAPKAKRLRKPVAPKAAKPVTARRTTTAAKSSKGSKSAATKPAYTSEDIALRAYFISEKRRQLGQSGSPESDWLEAERQLREGLSV